MSPAPDKTESIRSELHRLTISGTAYYVAEGDLLIPESEFADYVKRRLQPAPSAERIDTTKLIGISQNGKIVRWAPGVVLSYHIRKESFPTAEDYALARSTVTTATEEWMAVCGIEFRHDVALDSDASLRAPRPTLFDIRYFDAHGRFIAAAFFPNDPPERRTVLIDPSFFRADLQYDRTGTLRHELGHVLGFRHEHISSGAPPSCPSESHVGTIVLTNYDPQSVMHYFCGGVGDKMLRITDSDREGALKLYGPPLATFDLVQP